MGETKFLIITHYTVGTLQKCLSITPHYGGHFSDLGKMPHGRHFSGHSAVQTPPRTNFFGSPVVMTTVFLKKNPRALVGRCAMS